ncbi:MAG: apolipoprotein N-acyltransferase [Balneolaceae bacterium]
MNRLATYWSHGPALSLSAGVLLGLSFPPFGLPVLQIPAFVFLFRVADLSSGWRELAVRAYGAFLVWNLIATYWLMMATLAGGTAAILANSLLMLIPLLIIRYLLRSGIHPAVTPPLIAAIWVSYEFLHHNWDLAWPWLALGNGWADSTSLIQYISVTGHLGISFWVVVTAAVFYRAAAFASKKHLACAVLLALLFPAISLVMKAGYQEKSAQRLDVAVVQPNMNSYREYGGLATVDDLLTLLLELSDSARTETTDLIVWPENAIDSLIPRGNRFNATIRDSLRSWDTELITGTGYIDYYESGSEPSLVRGNISGRAYNIFNAAFHFTGERLPDIYKKGKLVPIVERIPFAESLSALDMSGQVNWGEIAGYGRGFHANNFLIGDQHATPALICYDSVFSHWVGNFVRNGAGFLTIITNDGWWGDTSGHKQHFSYARLRAIEFRRWIVRSANNGISGIISPDGGIRVETGYGIRTAFAHPIHPSDVMTFYARYGNWFNWLMLAVAVAGTAFTVRRGRLNRTGN